MSTAISLANAPLDRDVEADLHFLAHSAEKPRTYAFDPPGGGTRSNACYAAQRVPIHDARSHAAAFALDREGFAFVPHHSAVRDFWDDSGTARSRCVTPAASIPRTSSPPT